MEEGKRKMEEGKRKMREGKRKKEDDRCAVEEAEHIKLLSCRGLLLRPLCYSRMWVRWGENTHM
jgi:hypothetical protein